jgi:REP element-mobilizing transposase RayT
MKYNPDVHNRHSIRLRGYNYADAGDYFITICLNQRIPKIWRYAANLCFEFPTFGAIENGIMILNDSGKMVQQTWHEMHEHYPDIEIGEFVVMPDHIHGIITMNNKINNVGATHRGCPSTTNVCTATNCAISLPNLIHYLKTRTTNKYIDGVKTHSWQAFNKKLWQRNYYEHVIHDEAEYARIAKYIRKNPISWRKNRLVRILPQMIA